MPRSDARDSPLLVAVGVGGAIVACALAAGVALVRTLHLASTWTPVLVAATALALRPLASWPARAGSRVAVAAGGVVACAAPALCGLAWNALVHAIDAAGEVSAHDVIDPVPMVALALASGVAGLVAARALSRRRAAGDALARWGAWGAALALAALVAWASTDPPASRVSDEHAEVVSVPLDADALAVARTPPLARAELAPGPHGAVRTRLGRFTLVGERQEVREEMPFRGYREARGGGLPAGVMLAPACGTYQPEALPVRVSLHFRGGTFVIRCSTSEWRHCGTFGSGPPRCSSIPAEEGFTALRVALPHVLRRDLDALRDVQLGWIVAAACGLVAALAFLVLGARSVRTPGAWIEGTLTRARTVTIDGVALSLPAHLALPPGPVLLRLARHPRAAPFRDGASAVVIDAHPGTLAEFAQRERDRALAGATWALAAVALGAAPLVASVRYVFAG